MCQHVVGLPHRKTRFSATPLPGQRKGSKVTHDESGFPSQYVDTDPEETREWTESLDAVIEQHGASRARQIIRELLRHSSRRDLGVPAVRSTDYINTISPDDEPEFPGGGTC